MLFLMTFASSGFASVPRCTETVCPKPDHDGFIRPGCSSQLAANKTSTPMAGGTLCAPVSTAEQKTPHPHRHPNTNPNPNPNPNLCPLPLLRLADVHDSAAGAWEWSQIVDLGDAAVAAGCVPRHKPHMVLPSPNQAYVAVT